MHGKQKVKRTVDEEEKREKERAKKCAIYQQAMKTIFKKRQDGELDITMLQIISQVLTNIPDIATLWNIRREVLLKMKSADPSNFSDVMVPKEFDLTEICLKSNPKSYTAWHHRCWLMKETNFNKVENEVKLCAKYLQLDDRNFHVWDYRNFLLASSKNVTVEQELQFTTEKIVSNFSNYSSWHLRSTLLPRLSHNYLNEELDLVKNAAFTDPNDQSVWFYHRWLLRSQLPNETPNLICAFHTGDRLLTVFNVPVIVPTSLGLKVTTGDEDNCLQQNWSSPTNNTTSKLWILDLSEVEKPVESIQIWGENLMDFFNKEMLNLKVKGRSSNFPKYFDCETQPKSPEFEALLREELEWIQELKELEPKNKWTLSALILVMRLINFVEFKPEIMNCLAGLIKLDPMRKSYYKDLRSKYLMEWKLADFQDSTEEFDIAGLGVTSLYYLERLCFVKKINFRHNEIKNTSSFPFLQLCEEINLECNCLSCPTELVYSLHGMKSLKTVNLSNNPVCESAVADEIRNSWDGDAPYIIL